MENRQISSLQQNKAMQERKLKNNIKMIQGDPPQTPPLI